MSRPPVVTLLASLAAHGGALVLLFFLVAGESPPGVLFVDLESITERETPIVAPEPGALSGGPRKKQVSTDPGRRAPRGAGSARPAGPSAEATVPSPAPPAAPPREPEPAREPQPAQTASEEPRQPAPAAAIVPAREAAPDAPVRTETIAPSAAAGPNLADAPGERVASTTEQSGSGRAPSGAGTSGSGSGGAGAGSPDGSGGGSAGGAPGAEYGGYLAKVRSRLLEALRYPSPARSRGLTGTVRLEIFIRPDGAIGNVSVASSSSHPLLDEAALEAARSLEPQPFPKGLAPRALRVRLPVVFDLQ
jgi:protein TonB